MKGKVFGILVSGLLIGGGAIGAFQVLAKDNVTNQITEEQAKQIAETEVGGTASSLVVERESGKLIYEVLVGDREVEIDAETGETIEMENDLGIERFDHEEI